MSVKTKIIIRYIAIAFWLAFFIPFLYIFRPINHKVRRLMCRLILFNSGIKVKIEGSFDKSAKLLILNHQSMLDIISVETLHDANLCWVSKKEITDYFYYGHINKAPHMISIDREDKTGLVKLLTEAKDRLSKNRPIVIFPEGTRGKNSQMLPFKVGAKMLAEKLELRVQPIVVVDSARFLDQKHFARGEKLHESSEMLTIVAMPSFVPQKGSDWLNETRANMQSILDEKRANPV